MEPSAHAEDLGLELWLESLRERTVSPDAMNALVMDYLSLQGMKEAALAFYEESGTPIQGSIDEIETRNRIKEAIHVGDLERTEKLLRVFMPKVEEEDPNLHFSIQRSRLLELIGQGRTISAVKFARERLASPSETDAEKLQRLEEAMALVTFPSVLNENLDSLAEFKSAKHRHNLASEVNLHLLQRLYGRGESALASELRKLSYTQRQLADMAEVPLVSELETASYKLKRL